MSDDPKKKGQHDHSRITGRRNSASRPTVNKVGNSAAAVQQELSQNQSSH